jgi:type II secretory pathway pseudopilin PulG
MSLTELIVVIGLSAIVMAMVSASLMTLAKQNAINLARQSRVEGIREASLWLSDALSYASTDPTTASGVSFQEAQAQKMVFLSALPRPGSAETGHVSRVSLVLSGACWPGGDSEAGTLRRCVQYPVVAGDGTQSFCSKGSLGCDENLFEEKVLATNVKDTPIFGYSLITASDPATLTHAVTGANLAQIAAVELNLTVGGEPGTTEDIEATVIKRHNIKGWSKL